MALRWCYCLAARTQVIQLTAESYGTIWLGQGGLLLQSRSSANNTFEAYSSNADQLYAYNHGDLFASEFYDPSRVARNNWLFDQDGVAPGFATSKYYSDVDARYNWWGQPTGSQPREDLRDH